jgi:hypothetical protein
MDNAPNAEIITQLPNNYSFSFDFLTGSGLKCKYAGKTHKIKGA